MIRNIGVGLARPVATTDGLGDLPAGLGDIAAGAGAQIAGGSDPLATMGGAAAAGLSEVEKAAASEAEKAAVAAMNASADGKAVAAVANEMMKGAAMGAAIGSYFPFLGNIVGGVLGGAIGAIEGALRYGQAHYQYDSPQKAYYFLAGPLAAKGISAQVERAVRAGFSAADVQRVGLDSFYAHPPTQGKQPWQLQWPEIYLALAAGEAGYTQQAADSNRIAPTLKDDVMLHVGDDFAAWLKRIPPASMVLFLRLFETPAPALFKDTVRRLGPTWPAAVAQVMATAAHASARGGAAPLPPKPAPPPPPAPLAGNQVLFGGQVWTGAGTGQFGPDYAALSHMNLNATSYGLGGVGAPGGVGGLNVLSALYDPRMPAAHGVVAAANAGDTSALAAIRSAVAGARVPGASPGAKAIAATLSLAQKLQIQAKYVGKWFGLEVAQAVLQSTHLSVALVTAPPASSIAAARPVATATRVAP